MAWMDRVSGVVCVCVCVCFVGVMIGGGWVEEKKKKESIQELLLLYASVNTSIYLLHFKRINPSFLAALFIRSRPFFSREHGRLFPSP